MNGRAIAEDPVFITGFIRHLQKEKEACLQNGQLEEASQIKQSIVMMQLVLQNINDNNAADEKDAATKTAKEGAVPLHILT